MEINIQQKQSEVESIRDTLNIGESSLNSYSDPNFLDNSLNNQLSGLIRDPVSGVLNKTVLKINNLTSVIENKINKLTEELVSSVDKKGRVQLVGNVIVITVKQKDVDEFNAEKIRLENKIKSINNNINNLKNVLKILSNISRIINIIKTALDIQELALSINPVSKAALTVFKKAINILFLKEMLKQYAGVLSTQLKLNQQKLNNIINRFRNLHVSIVVQNDDTGQTNDKQATDQILSDLLSSDSDNSLQNASDEITTSSGKVLIIKVEKYGQKELIARAYDKFSGMLIAETAPSFVSTSQDLISELQDIVEFQ